VTNKGTVYVMVGRLPACPTRTSFWTPVFTGRVHGCRSTVPVIMDRRQGTWTRV